MAHDPFVLMDTRTGRRAGDHGSAGLAIEFALEARFHDFDQGNQLAFLSAWQDGSAFDEWPEFYAWLAERERGL